MDVGTHVPGRDAGSLEGGLGCTDPPAGARGLGCGVLNLPLLPFEHMKEDSENELPHRNIDSIWRKRLWGKESSLRQTDSRGNGCPRSRRHGSWDP